MRAIPQDWCQTDISQIGDVVSGGTPSTKIEKYWSGDINWITPADLSGYSRKHILRGRKSITPEGVRCSSARLVPAGTVLFSSRAPVGYVAIAEGYLCTNQGFKNLVPFAGVDSNFLYYYFKSIKGLANSLATGTTFKELSGKAFASLPVVVAPLIEQCAIVVKIEALFSELDKGVEQLETLRGQLKRYRQSVLKAAFEGKLTIEWRAERARPFVQDREQLKVAETPATYSTKKHPPLTEDELAELAELPEGWRWVKVDNLGKIETGSTPNTKNEAFFGGQWCFYKPTDLNAGSNVTTASDSLSELGIQHSRFLPAGSVLVTCIGATIGKAGLIHAPGASNQQINAIIPLPSFNSRFIYWQVVSFDFQKQIMCNASSTTLPILNKSRFQSLPFRVAPLSEQHQIVAEIEASFSALDQLEQTVETGLKQAEALRQSILKKAFVGRLLSASELAAVRADPAYEPAAKLLERIRAERATSTIKERRSGPKRGTGVSPVIV